MKKFIITEEEKNRILGMHKTATSKNYLTESAMGDSITALNTFYSKNIKEFSSSDATRTGVNATLAEVGKQGINPTFYASLRSPSSDKLVLTWRLTQDTLNKMVQKNKPIKEPVFHTVETVMPIDSNKLTQWLTKAWPFTSPDQKLLNNIVNNWGKK